MLFLDPDFVDFERAEEGSLGLHAAVLPCNAVFNEAVDLYFREDVKISVFQVVGELVEKLKVLADLFELIISNALEEQVRFVAEVLLHDLLAADFEPQVILQNVRDFVIDSAEAIEDDLQQAIDDSFHEDVAALGQRGVLIVSLQDGRILLFVFAVACPQFGDDCAVVRDVLVDEDATFRLAGMHDLEDVLDDCEERVLAAAHVLHQLVQVRLELPLLELAKVRLHAFILFIIKYRITNSYSEIMHHKTDKTCFR